MLSAHSGDLAGAEKEPLIKKQLGPRVAEAHRTSLEPCCFDVSNFATPRIVWPPPAKAMLFNTPEG